MFAQTKEERGLGREGIGTGRRRGSAIRGTFSNSIRMAWETMIVVTVKVRWHFELEGLDHGFEWLMRAGGP